MNSEKGESFFEKCRDSFEIMEIKLDELKWQNTNLNYPTPMPEKRKTVYMDCIVDGSLCRGWIFHHTQNCTL